MLCDHDLFPVFYTDVPTLPSSQPFYGHIQKREDKWYIWPGYHLIDYRWLVENINRIDLVRKSRQNSLDYLTKSVIMYIKEAKSDYINLNKIAKDIKIQKRRLYDIINVLQGK